jgi:hypothetical protein
MIELETMMKSIGMIASIALPLFNLPLILKIRRRGSSRDISLTWAVGVWACIILMFPSAIVSEDVIFRAFSVVNTLFFSGVLVYVLKYRKKKVRDGDQPSPDS